LLDVPLDPIFQVNWPRRSRCVCREHQFRHPTCSYPNSAPRQPKKPHLRPFSITGFAHIDHSDVIASVGKNEDAYPRKKAANALTRRGNDVHATHTAWVNFRSGNDRRPNVGLALTNPFSPAVKKGLTQGERVTVYPSDKISPGIRVSPK
jgi:hypothetical protein